MLGNVAATLNASKSVLLSTLKNGSMPSKDATPYDRHITPTAETSINHSEPNFSGVTADASVV